VTNRLLVRILLGIVAGAIGIALGLYFGRFLAGAIAFPFATLRQLLPFITGIAWWGLIGLLGGIAWALALFKRGRLRFLGITLLGFALGGALAALLGSLGASGRDPNLIGLAVPLGGALAGLAAGLAARLGARALITTLAGALAMWIARPHFDFIPPADVLALLAPGGMLGAVLAILKDPA
jgi:hypothetical protein